MPQPKIVWLASIIVVVLAVAGFYLISSKNMPSNENTDYCVGPTAECVGKKVKFYGIISTVTMPESGYKNAEYPNIVWLENKRFAVVAVHSKTPIEVNKIDKNNKIEVVGTVVEVSAAAPVKEYEILADEWKYYEIR